MILSCIFQSMSASLPLDGFIFACKCIESFSTRAILKLCKHFGIIVQKCLRDLSDSFCNILFILFFYCRICSPFGNKKHLSLTSLILCNHWGESLKQMVLKFWAINIIYHSLSVRSNKFLIFTTLVRFGFLVF